MLRPTIFGKIALRGHEVARDRRQRPGNQRGVWQGGDADRSVVPFANQIYMSVTKVKVNGDLGIKRQKLRQDWRNMEYAKRNWRREAYVAARQRRMCNDLVFRRLTLR